MIRIQNIYYMLAYAYQALQGQGYKNFGTEEFDSIADLMSAILVKGVSAEIKHGLGRTYVEKREPLHSVRGKIDATESLKRRTMLKKQLACVYDDFSINSYQNRILKTTMKLLIKSDIPKTRKKELRNLLFYFEEVEVLDARTINWSFNTTRSTQNRKMLMAICELTIKGLLQTPTTAGPLKLLDFSENEMNKLYEKFILKYYKKHFPETNPAAQQIKWALDNENDTMLPIMKSDIMLKYNDKTLIIDAKYYGQVLQAYFGASTVHSSNLYQIFTYVKNQSICGGEVEGLLLYAGTDEESQPGTTYKMSGNKISVKTLDLNCEFKKIAAQLNAIADNFLRTLAP